MFCSREGFGFVVHHAACDGSHDFWNRPWAGAFSFFDGIFVHLALCRYGSGGMVGYACRAMENPNPGYAGHIRREPRAIGFSMVSFPMAGWLVVVAGWGVCIAAIGIWLSPLQLMFLTSAVTLLNVLSFVPGGLGVAEVSTVVALAHFGVSDALAQAGAIILRSYGLVIIFCGVIHFAIWRIALRAKE